MTSSFFEIRLFYVRVSPCSIDTIPPSLTFSHLRRPIAVCLEINGSKIPSTDPTVLLLRRDRVDHDASEVTYVCTDGVKLTGAVDFEVLDDNKTLILCGSLEKMEATSSNSQTPKYQLSISPSLSKSIPISQNLIFVQNKKMAIRALWWFILLPFVVKFVSVEVEETCSWIVPMRKRLETISIMDFGGVGDGRTLNTWCKTKQKMAIRALWLFILLPFVVKFVSVEAEEICSWIVPMRKRPETISIMDFGGVGDGKTLNTWPFRKAVYMIQHLRRRGGTKLYVPPGVWLTGNFNLTSYKTLYLARGAVIKATMVNYYSLFSIIH